MQDKSRIYIFAGDFFIEVEVDDTRKYIHERLEELEGKYRKTV